VHQGDIECVTVRVTPGFNEIIFVRYEAHGDSIFYSRSQVEYLPQTTRPIVLSAYNSHGCWNPADGVKIKDGRIALDRAPLFLTFVDIVERGRVWRNYPLAFAGLDETGEPINDQRWARFAGRLGVQRYNVYTRPEAIGGGSLSSGEHSDVNSLMQLGEVIDALFSSLPSERHDGEGPGGLAGRPIAQTRRPYWVWPPPLLGVHRGGRDDDMWWCTFGARPGAWSEDLRFTQGNKTGATPAIARLGSTIYCVHNGSGDSDLWWCTFDRVTEKWSEDQRFTRGNRSAHGVALAVLDGTLYCVHRGSSDADLWWCVFDPNTRTWSEDQRLPDHCSAAAPALAVLNGVLYCVHRGASDTDLWWCRFNPATKQWSQAQRFTQGNQCGSGPGLAAHEGRLYCVHAGARDPYLWWCVFDPTTNSWSQDRQFTNGNVIGGDAALAIVNGVLYCAHSGHRDGYLWFCTFDPRSQTWSEDARFGRDNQGSFGVGLLVNPFA
jgi:hypothetical protein